MENKQNLPRFMTIRELARTGILPENAIRTLVKTGQAPCIFVGRKALINVTKFLEQLEGI